MSEPASLVMQCRITLDGLRRSLAAREPRVSDWGDWDQLGITLAPHEIAEMDQRSGAGIGDLLRRLRASAERPADWLCAYDPGSLTLSVGQVLFSDNWLTILPVLAVLRRLGGFMAEHGEAGVILVQDWVFGHRGTMAAVSLFPGGSAVRVPDDPEWDVEGFAASILSPLRDAVSAGRLAPVRDDLDMLLGRD